MIERVISKCSSLEISKIRNISTSGNLIGPNEATPLIILPFVGSRAMKRDDTKERERKEREAGEGRERETYYAALLSAAVYLNIAT